MELTSICGRSFVQAYFDVARMLDQPEDPLHQALLRYFLNQKAALCLADMQPANGKTLLLEVDLFALPTYSIADMDNAINAQARAAALDVQAWLSKIACLVDLLNAQLMRCANNRQFDFEYQRYPSLVHQKAFELLQTYPALLAPYTPGESLPLAVLALADAWSAAYGLPQTYFEELEAAA